MNIGEAAAAAGVSAKMIRYYESIGLVMPAGRTEAGYRVYAQSDVHRLGFIRRARNLGFTMDQISVLLALWQDRSRPSREVKQLAEQHLKLLRQKIDHLQAMADTLQELTQDCCGNERPDCPILSDLGAANGRTSGLESPSQARLHTI